MVVRNMRRSLVEYHDILWDIDYAKTFQQAYVNLHRLYAERPPLEDFLGWRDLRVMDEIHWYGWFIDYYMEEGKHVYFSILKFSISCFLISSKYPCKDS